MALLGLFNFLHFVGLAFGLGGATMAAIISMKAEKDKDVAKAYMKIIPSIAKFIWLGLSFLIISGIVLPFYIGWPINKQMLLIKHVLVVGIIIIGIMIGLASRKIEYLKIGSGDFLQKKKEMKLFSIVNLLLWHIVTFLSVFV